MSADNWAVCPACLAAEEQRIALLQERVRQGYGVIPIEEFDLLRSEAGAPIDTDKLRTFREDYEFYGAEEGTIKVVYGGECNVCHVGISFKDERPFWTPHSGGPTDG